MTTGAALKARRERLGWDMMQAAKAAMQQHQPKGTWLNGDIADVENGSWKYGHVLPAAYDAALTAEEQRRVREEAREALADLRAADEPRLLKSKAGRSHGDFILKHMPEKHYAWWVLDSEQVTPLLRERYDAILDALAMMAGETPERVATWDAEAQHYRLMPALHDTHTYAPSTKSRALAESWGYRIVGGPETPADTDSMPTPPEGVTVRECAIKGQPTTIVVSGPAGSLGVRAERAVHLRYAADLAEWAQRQHTHTQQAEQEAERQRLRDAVREAEEAELTAADAKDEAWKAYDATLAPLGRAREALWAAREAARKGGAL